MAYRLERDEAIGAGVRRVAREQVEKALAEVRDGSLDRAEVVHRVRKRCKKVRATLRLVRPGLGDAYARENARYRDAARRLARFRDAQAVLESHDALLDAAPDGVGRAPFAPLRRELARRAREATADASDLERALARFVEDLEEGRDALGTWRLEGGGRDALRGGLAKTYGRARGAMEAAYDEPSGARFHEWRKRVKYHGYHLRLLRPVWKGPMGALRDAAGELADLLGDDHDLVVLEERVLAEPDAFGDADTLRAYVGLAAARRAALRARARPLGARLLAEAPKRMAERVDAWRRAWRADPGAPPAEARVAAAADGGSGG